MKFITCLINLIFENETPSDLAKNAERIELLSSRQSTLLRSLNHEKNPLKDFLQFYSPEEATR